MIALLFSLLLPPAEEPPSDTLAREVMASMGRLQSAKSYRLKMEDMIIEFQNPGPTIRLRQKTRVSGFDGTRETVVAGKTMASRIVSPELEAHIAKVKALKRQGDLVAIGGSIRSALQSLAYGPYGWLGALSAARSAAHAARDLAKPDSLEHYFQWECMELPYPIIPQASNNPDPATSFTVTKIGTDEAKVTAYETVSITRLPDEKSLTMKSRVWIDADGYPRKTEISFGPEDKPLVMEYYDFNASDISVEVPTCQQQKN